MSLRKSFIKPRPGAYPLSDYSEKKQGDLSLPYGRKLSSKSIEDKQVQTQMSFNIGGRRLPVGSEGRKPFSKIDAFNQKRQATKSGIYKPIESKSFGVSNGFALQNQKSEVSGGALAKKSMR